MYPAQLHNWAKAIILLLMYTSLQPKSFLWRATSLYISIQGNNHSNLGVKCCFVFCIISCVLLHEDRNPVNIFKIDAHLVRNSISIFSFLQLNWWSYDVCYKCCSFMDVVCTQFLRFESRALPSSIWYEMQMNWTWLLHGSLRLCNIQAFSLGLKHQIV